MPDLAAVAGRLTRAAADLDAERQRDDGPRSREVRRIVGNLYDVVGDLTGAAYDIDADRAQRDRGRDLR